MVTKYGDFVSSLQFDNRLPAPASQMAGFIMLAALADAALLHFSHYIGGDDCNITASQTRGGGRIATIAHVIDGREVIFISPSATENVDRQNQLTPTA